MTIYLATDHAGFNLKEKIKTFLLKKKYRVQDFGAFFYIPDDDYPDFIKLAAEKISKNPKDRAIIFGGSGQGEAMVANRFKNVRAAIYYGGSEKIIKFSRQHNDANILSLGARFLSKKEALAAVRFWLGVKFSGEARHRRRLTKLAKI